MATQHGCQFLGYSKCQLCRPNGQPCWLCRPHPIEPTMDVKIQTQLLNQLLYKKENINCSKIWDHFDAKHVYQTPVKAINSLEAIKALGWGHSLNKGPWTRWYVFKFSLAFWDCLSPIVKHEMNVVMNLNIH